MFATKTITASVLILAGLMFGLSAEQAKAQFIYSYPAYSYAPYVPVYSPAAMMCMPAPTVVVPSPVYMTPAPVYVAPAPYYGAPVYRSYGYGSYGGYYPRHYYRPHGRSFSFGFGYSRWR